MCAYPQICPVPGSTLFAALMQALKSLPIAKTVGADDAGVPSFILPA
jgi:hypothetical protein